MVPEFRAVTVNVNGSGHKNRRRRLRRNKDEGFGGRERKLVSLKGIDDRDPIVDASDDSFSERRQPSNAATRGRRMEPSQVRRQPFRDPADVEIVGPSGKAPRSQRTKPFSQAAQPPGAKRRSMGDLDELSEDVVHDTARGATRQTNINSIQNRLPQSASLSHRADITASRFAPTVPNPTSVLRFPVKGCLCLPGHIYSSSRGTPDGFEADDPCFLKPTQGPPVALIACNDDGSEAVDLGWLRVDPPRVQRVHYSKNSPIVKIAQSSLAEKSIGGTMFLEFFEWEDAERLVKWMGADTADYGRVESQWVQPCLSCQRTPC